MHNTIIEDNPTEIFQLNRIYRKRFQLRKDSEPNNYSLGLDPGPFAMTFKRRRLQNQLIEHLTKICAQESVPKQIITNGHLPLDF